MTNPKVRIGAEFRAYCWLHINGPGHVKLGRKVSVGRGFQRKPTILTHSPDAVVEIGDDCWLSGTRISCTNSVLVDRQSIFSSATLIDCDIVPLDNQDLSLEWIADHSGRIKIGKHCWLGINCFVLKDSILGDGTVVAAGALVRGTTVGDGKLLLGNPARLFGQATK